MLTFTLYCLMLILLVRILRVRIYSATNDNAEVIECVQVLPPHAWQCLVPRDSVCMRVLPGLRPYSVASPVANVRIVSHRV